MSKVGLFMRLSLQQSWFSFMQWQPDSERRAATNVAFQFDAPVVCADNSLDDHQAEARSFFLRRIKRFENPVDLLLRNSAAGVGHAQPHTVAGLASLQRQ